MDNNEQLIKDIVKAYKEKQLLYGEFSESVKNILKKILENNRILFLVVTNRAKGIDKLEKKLKRLDNATKEIYLARKNIKKYYDVEDLAGTRVIFYFESEIDKFIKELKKVGGFVFIKEKDKRRDVGSYNAYHLIVELDDTRINLPEYLAFRNLKCEIQLTTALWHAWSEPEHKLIYKDEEGLKKINTRAYDSIKNELKDIKKNYIDKVVLKLNAVYSYYEKVIAGKPVFDIINYFKQLLQYNSNNKIFDDLEFAEKQINYGVAFMEDKVLEIVQDFRSIIEKAKQNKTEDINTHFGKIAGKTVFDVVDKILAILERIKLKIFPESLFFLVELYNNQEHSSHDKIINIIGDLAKYNYNVLKQIGYGVQIKILEIIEKWSPAERSRNAKLIKIMAREMLKPSFEGYDMVDYKTINIKGGTLRVNDKLKNL